MNKFLKYALIFKKKKKVTKQEIAIVISCMAETKEEKGYSKTSNYA
jgi:hypothetical protein